MNIKSSNEGRGKYPGIGYVGCEQLSGIYGVDGGIVDVKGTGLLHLFYKTYEIDLIHSACTMLKIEDKLYYGNKCEHKNTHQIHMKPSETKVLDGYVLSDAFLINEGKVLRQDYVSAFGENTIWFRSDITNLSDKAIIIKAYAYANVNPFEANHAYSSSESTYCHTGHSIVQIDMKKSQLGYVGLDAPTGFLYGATQSIFYDETRSMELSNNVASIYLLREQELVLESGEKKRVEWCLRVTDSSTPMSPAVFEEFQVQEQAYWQQWFDEGQLNKLTAHAKLTKVNLCAMRASCLNGFVPADLTGHYYANNMPCYYARDAMMVARSFMMAGYYNAFEAIMMYLIGRNRKPNGEFYQRYNGLGEPDEGANNDVFHQLDSIGFFMYNIRKYYELTGKQLASFDVLKSLFQVLEQSDNKNGLIGIEGGVNEGVYGGAYITSSNAFISGGLKSYRRFVVERKELEHLEKIDKLIEQIDKGIDSAYLEDETRYCYGYVDYHNNLIKKYDTPIYFGVLYGWDSGMTMLNTHQYLKKHATYFDYGMGYSEQEYHHGPWLFNTAAAAQYAWLSDDKTYYDKAMSWMEAHANRYGLMVEAIDADNENNCFINPLTWACAEYVAASFICVTEDIGY